MAHEELMTAWDYLHYQYLRVRQKSRRHFKRKTVFFFSLLITYLLTIGLTVGSIVIQLDGMYAPDLAQTNTDASTEPGTVSQKDTTSENTDSVSGTFEFYSCTGLNTGMFIAAKMLETLVPTAITFSGTILILQTDSSTKRTWIVWLFLVITLLVVGGIVLPTAKTLAFLEAYLWTLGVLCLASIVLSWHAFYDPVADAKRHKNELSDGKMVF